MMVVDQKNEVKGRAAKRLIECLICTRDSLEGLLSVSERKKAALISGDIDVLEKQLGVEETYRQHLSELNAQRQFLYETLVDSPGKTNQPVSTEKVLRSLSGQMGVKVKKLVEQCRVTGKKIRREVAFNIALAEQTSRHAQGLISIIYGSAGSKSYDQKGRTRIGPGRIMLVNSQA